MVAPQMPRWKACAAWRTQFLAAQGGNGTRIATLENQIAALGPVPEGGAVEPIELSDRRRARVDQPTGQPASPATPRGRGL